MRVLLIEDDFETAALLKDEIERYYTVDVAHNGSEGSYLSQINDYDAMVVDMSLSDMSGEEICRLTRAAKIATPILAMTRGHEVTPKVSSLDSGADDCLSKPFSTLELLARLRALMRRQSRILYSTTLQVEDLYIDFSCKTVSRAGHLLTLRRKEFDILEYLVRNKNRVISKEMILDHVWEMGIEVNSNTIEVHIRSLRAKIDKDYTKKLIKTVHNFGYKIDA
ncbi:MAG TPA: response regulator transcription factor [Candidatus Saccharimonadales bacterium]|nr:response regulator transcription factor [Candidatus Saccharimonadales bacterium]